MNSLFISGKFNQEVDHKCKLCIIEEENDWTTLKVRFLKSVRKIDGGCFKSFEIQATVFPIYWSQGTVPSWWKSLKGSRKGIKSCNFMGTVENRIVHLIREGGATSCATSCAT